MENGCYLKSMVDRYAEPPKEMSFTQALNYLEIDQEAELFTKDNQGIIFLRREGNKVIAFNQNGEEIETTLAKLSEKKYLTSEILYSQESFEEILFCLNR